MATCPSDLRLHAARSRVAFSITSIHFLDDDSMDRGPDALPTIPRCAERQSPTACPVWTPGLSVSQSCVAAALWSHHVPAQQRAMTQHRQASCHCRRRGTGLNLRCLARLGWNQAACGCTPTTGLVVAPSAAKQGGTEAPQQKAAARCLDLEAAE